MGAVLRMCFCKPYENLDNEPELVYRYDGETNCLGQRHGYGSYLFANGDLYEGCWKFNKMHGYGQFTTSSGQKQEGFFHYGKFIGKLGCQSRISDEPSRPFPQTVQDENEQAIQAERARKREQRHLQREKERDARKKQRKEFYKKYSINRGERT